MLSELMLYTWLNVIPVCDYYIAPGSEIAPGSYLGSSMCDIVEIRMDSNDNIEIICEEIKYD